MTQARSFASVLAVVAVLGLNACGPSPTAPVALPLTSPPAVVLGAATPLLPANGATLPPDTITTFLTSRNVSVPSGLLVFHSFEVARDAAFGDVLQSTTLPQASGDSTTLKVSGLEQTRTYYWRVRAAAGESLGVRSEAYTFSVGRQSGIAPPELDEPQDGTFQGARPAINVRPALADPALGAVTQHLELSRDPNFGSVAIAMDKAQSTTSLTLFRFTSDLASGTYFWRVRASAGAVTSAWSGVRRFEVTNTVVEMPTPLLPQPGETIPSQRVTMTVANAVHSGNASAATYWFQISRTLDFSAPILWVGVVQIDDRPSSLQSGDLSPGTYYWRAQTRVASVSSAWTEPRSFIVSAEAIQAPQPLQPAVNATVYAQPTLVVSNAVRTGGGGALTYRFELAINVDALGFSPESLVATAVVPESTSGQTAWLVPVPLVPGQLYRWRVQVFDSSTGIEAPNWVESRFTTVPAAERLWFLDIDLPATCKTSANSSSYYGTSDSALGTASFQLKTTGTLELQFDGTAGTIAGNARVIGKGYTARIAAAPNVSTAARLIGSVRPDGTAVGMFDGYVMFSDSFDGGGSCAGSGIRWIIRPR